MTSVHSLGHLAAASVCVQLKRYIACVPDEIMISEKNSVSLMFEENLFLPTAVSEKLIYMLSKSELLTNTTLALFSSKNTQLKRLNIPDASTLSPSGMEPLREHKLRSLEIRKAKFNIHTLIDCLNEWTVQKLEVLKFNDSFHGCRELFTNLTKLKNLRELDVSDTDFENQNLQIVCDHLPNLESLNISGTLVDSIIPLDKCPQLRRLSIADLLLQSHDEERRKRYDNVLLGLKELQHLDVSHGGGGDSFRRLTSYDNFRYKFKIMNWPKCLPNLISLDISGQNDIDETSLIEFLDHHPNLIFLGFMSDVSKSNLFINPKHPNYRPNLRVTGIGSIDQIALAMRLYNEREDFIQTSLFNLYTLSDDKLGPRPDLIQLVTKQMEVYRYGMNIQMACTACLYNLTKHCAGSPNLSENIPLPVLNIVVERILDVMILFPAHFQIQKNALLTLCNDRILQETKMDRFKCAEAVLNTFCRFQDPFIERLCLAVCSVVAAKMSSSETHRIGSNKQFLNKLLQIIEQKINDNLSVDSTLGFALSTLWNLTDESPSTCLEFLDLNGLRLLKKMLLEKHITESMLTKTLGLLNNIAEVSTSREALMDIDIITLIRSLSKSESIEISYFAAGILANLVSAGPASWTVSELPRSVILMELETVIMSWKEADEEMVAYRSFKPFLPLLRCFETHPSQLWALWAIKHVLTVHARRYYEMLRAECVFDILEELKTSKKTHEHVRALSNAILERLWVVQMTKIQE